MFELWAEKFPFLLTEHIDYSLQQQILTATEQAVISSYLCVGLHIQRQKSRCMLYSIV